MLHHKCFPSQQLQNKGASFVCIYSFRSSHQRCSFKKGVLKNFAKFLRTRFLQTTSEQLLLSFIKFRSFINKSEKDWFMLHKKFIPNYQLSFLNKKLTEVFFYIKTNEKMGTSHQSFYPSAPFFQDGGYKTRRIIKYFSKETKKWIYLCKTCYYINFL